MRRFFVVTADPDGLFINPEKVWDGYFNGVSCLDALMNYLDGLGSVAIDRVDSLVDATHYVNPGGDMTDVEYFKVRVL